MGLLTDRRGGLWIASESGLISRLFEGEFRTRYLPERVASGGGTPVAKLATNQAWQNLSSTFALDNTGAVWARTITGEVFRFPNFGAASAVPLVNLPPTAQVFAAGKPNGWMRAQLQDNGMKLELRWQGFND
ncbi:hypothetical protein [Pedosphaera parvula]|uniref:Two component regulator propeller domain protein n=1 Tax=Pedosphaera parvula (strain Ellin514) TaxID=320771 RepID=B9XE12_PEDPL|nr:hypothetical protein [Pedosphaera parvula]EEF61903.1 hypothetical protein Cflav_PD4566 [Pedosphaera parvula Ellin514]